MMINTLEELYNFDKAPLFSLIGYGDFFMYLDPKNKDKVYYTSVNITGYIPIPNKLYNDVIHLAHTYSPNGLVLRKSLLDYIITKRNKKLNKI